MKVKTGNAHIYHNSKRFDADTCYDLDETEGAALLELGATLCEEPKPVVASKSKKKDEDKDVG